MQNNFTITMESLYILQLANGKHYVGKTTDVIKRFDQHKNGVGSAWTKLHKPIRLVESRPLTGAHDETNTTKDLMKKYGIDNVRGGAYTAVDLSDEQRAAIEHEAKAADDTCYKCGQSGHFANRCLLSREVVVMETKQPSKHARDRMFLEHVTAEKAEEWECKYCDRTFNTKYGCSVHERSCASKRPSPPPSPPKKGACYRCGRTGHYSPDCYARKHVRGYDLDE